MVAKEKLLKKVLEGGTKNIRFDDFLQAMKASGFYQDRVRGSHFVMRHPGLLQPFPVQQDGNGKAKPYQVKQFRTAHKSLSEREQ